MHQFVYLLRDGKCVGNVEIRNPLNVKSQIDQHLLQNFQLESFYLTQNGKRFTEDDVLAGEFVSICTRLPGGKGGFGSMLRAIGAQIEKTTNREACRDLSGRRLRDINEEQRLKKWVSEQADREKEREDRKKKKIERLKQEPKHEFKDADYDKIRAEMMDKVHSAIEEGLKVSSSLEDQPSTSAGVKRKFEVKQKKSNLLWIDDLGSDVSDSDDDECDKDEKKRIKTA